MSVKGVIFDVKKYSIHDGPGVRTTVHFKGCPLACWWCHNPESQGTKPAILLRSERCIACGTCMKVCPVKAISVQKGVLVTNPELCRGCGKCCDACPAEAREICGRSYTVPELMEQLRKDEPFFRDGGGVTFSGGEPLMQPEFLLEALQACEAEGYHTAIDTSGYCKTETILEIAKHASLFLYDIKQMDPVLHKKYTGLDNALILKNLQAISEAGAVINIRLPFMPGLNSDDEELHKIGALVKNLKGITFVSILPYHTAAKGKHDRWHMAYKLNELQPPTDELINHAADILKSYGLKIHIGA